MSEERSLEADVSIDIPIKNKINCRTCGRHFANKKMLYKHRQIQHGAGDVVKESPFIETPAPWMDPETKEVVDSDLEEVYNNNIGHILKLDDTESLLKKFNYPTNDLQEGVSEINNHLDKIYQKVGSSFKINIAFGFILRNKIMGEYRYFIPYKNNFILNKPFVVTNTKNLNRLKLTLKKIDPKSHIFNSRPNSNFVPVMITNIHYDVTPLNFPLGCSTTAIPNYILSNRHILTFHQYKDNLCFFRCLSQHLNGNILKHSILALLSHWSRLKKKSFNYSNFKGVTLKDISKLEELFHININIYELTNEDRVVTHYTSMGQFPSTMYLNVVAKHFTYIKSINAFHNLNVDYVVRFSRQIMVVNDMKELVVRV
jgi:hypothetical protein